MRRPVLKRNGAIVTVALALVALVIGAGLWQRNVAADQRETYQAAWAALLDDPIIAGLLERGNARCPGVREAFIWACGVTLRFDHPAPNELCSSPDQPRFAGHIDTGAKGPGETWGWHARYRLPLDGLVPCSGQDCADVFLVGSDSPAAAAFNRIPPPPRIGDHPVWPDFENRATYGTWQDGAWAKMDGAPVFFHFGQAPLGGLDGHRPRIGLQAIHPTLPLKINLRLPFVEKEHWRDHLGTLFQELTARVVRHDTALGCAPDPETVRFGLNPFRDDLLRQMRDWAIRQGG